MLALAALRQVARTRDPSDHAHLADRTLRAREVKSHSRAQNWSGLCDPQSGLCDPQATLCTVLFLGLIPKLEGEASGKGGMWDKLGVCGPGEDLG